MYNLFKSIETLTYTHYFTKIYYKKSVEGQTLTKLKQEIEQQKWTEC